MLKKLIGGVVILAAVAFGGYVGYCMVFKGETFFQAMGSAQKKVEAEVGARLTPLRRADLEYGRSNRPEALKHYQEALRRTDLPAAPAKEKLTDKQREHVVQRIAELTGLSG